MKEPIYEKSKVEILENLKGEANALTSTVISFKNGANKLVDENGDAKENGIALLNRLIEEKHKSPFFQHYFKLELSTDTIQMLKLNLPKEILAGMNFYKKIVSFSTYSALSCYAFLRQRKYLCIALEEALQKECPNLFLTQKAKEMYVLTEEEQDLQDRARIEYFTFRITMPLFVKNQLVKHSLDVGWNEVSRRYTDKEITFYEFETNENDKILFRVQDKDRKQCTKEDEFVAERGDMRRNVGLAFNYLELNSQNGAGKEQIRAVLPQSMMTTVIMTANIKALARMLYLRLNKDTQKETREVAEQIKAIVDKKAKELDIDLNKLMELESKSYI